LAITLIKWPPSAPHVAKKEQAVLTCCSFDERTGINELIRTSGVCVLQSHLFSWVRSLALSIKNWYLEMNSNASVKYNNQLGVYSSSFLQRDHWPEISRQQNIH
jgi:hypothetical protein